MGIISLTVTVVFQHLFLLLLFVLILIFYLTEMKLTGINLKLVQG